MSPHSGAPAPWVAACTIDALSSTEASACRVNTLSKIWPLRVFIRKSI